MEQPAVRHWRPRALPQQESSDCGIAAVAALATMYGHAICPGALRERVGSTERGLTLRNARDLLREAGFGAEVMRMPASFAASYPAPCIAIARGIHYLVLGKRQRLRRTVFDPASGWRRLRYRELDVELGDLVICVTSVPAQVAVPLRQPLPLLRWLRSFSIGSAVAAIAATALFAQLLGLGLPWLSGYLVDHATGASAGIGTGGHDLPTLLLFGTASLFSMLSALLTAEITWRLRRRLTRGIARDLAAKALHKSIAFLRGQSPNLLCGRMLSSVAIQDLATEQLPAILINAALLGGAMLIICSKAPWLALLALTGVSVKATIDLGLRASLADAQERQFMRRAEHASTLTETLRNIALLRAYLALPQALHRLDAACAESVAADYAMSRLQRLQNAGFGIIDTIDRIAFIAIGTWMIGRLDLSAGDFLAITLYRETLVRALDGLRRLRSNLYQVQGAAARIEYLAGPDATVAAAPAAEHTHRAGHAAGGRIEHGTVTITDMSYAYSYFSPAVFANFSLTIHDGENVAIVGPSGAGKSTLARLLCGTLQPTAGRVIIGGVDLASAEAPRALLAIGTVMQDDRLYQGSLLDNIDMLRGLPVAMIEHAAAVADIHDFIQSLPMRYRTSIDDHAMHLSGGQRQRILLARALAGNVRVLIMDEATSQLDVDTERRIMGRIRQLAITRIMFAHRPDTIRAADRIIDLRSCSALGRAAA
jgi:ATP-binding cassette subfamily B protein RaxB